MINQIFIDTNIYRQLGMDFTNNIDYVNLKRYCYGSGSEIRLSNVVLDELLNYYENEIVNSSIKSIKKSISKLKAISNDKIPNFSFSEKKKKELLNSIKQNIESDTLYAGNDLIADKELIKFLIINKQNTKKDNTRDFLIFLSLAKIAQEYPEDQIIIISNDNIFENNDYFKEYLDSRKINNIKNYKSIASFLGEYSIKLDYVTKTSLLKLITTSELKKQINEDIHSIPSHISRFYYSVRRKFKVELFEIENIKVTDFYLFKDLASNKLKVLFHVIPRVNIAFEPEKDIEALNNYLIEISNKPKYHLETFDEKYRPIYNTEIMFIYTVTIDEIKKSFEKIEFIDFFPDYYQ